MSTYSRRSHESSRSKTKDDVELGLFHQSHQDMSPSAEVQIGFDADPEVVPATSPAMPTSAHTANGSHKSESVSHVTAPRPLSSGDIQDVVQTTEADTSPHAMSHTREAIGGPLAGRPDPLPRKRFGINVNQLAGRPFQSEHFAQGAPQDYRKKYPADEAYKEIDPDARVFLVYNDESQIFDNEMVAEAGDNLDILLVFAGLFSAVLTTFVAQTSQSLSPDKTDITNSLLREMISLQRAQATGISFDTISAADTSFTASRTDIWVNGLWFTSLALSLSTALIAVIAKQWLRQYSSFISGSARTRAFIRQFRYDGLNKWRVPVVIGLLPTLLHISLFIFMAGLVVFLRPLNHSHAYVVAVTTGFLCVTYMTMNILPVFLIQCPYRTTLSEILFRLHDAAKSVILHIILWCGKHIVNLIALTAPTDLDSDSWQESWLENKLPDPNRPKSLKDAERTFADSDDLSRTGDTLSWLANNTSDPSAKAIVAQAVGSSAFDPMMSSDQYNALWGTLDQQWKGIDHSLRLQPDGPMAMEAEMHLERLIRATFRHAPIYTAQKINQNLSVRIHSAMLAIATCGLACRFRLVENDWRDLAPYQVFDFLLGTYSDAVQAELRAPTWMWWSICTQAAEPAEHKLAWPDFEEIRDICNRGCGNIEKYRMEEWLMGVTLPREFRRAVNEQESRRDPGRPSSSLGSVVSLAGFFAANFKSFAF